MFALMRFELRKLTAQRRSLVAFLAIGGMNALFAAAFLLRRHRASYKPMRGMEERLVGEFLNALTYTQVILAPCMFMIFPMVLAIIGGHLFAGEMETGTLRMTAVRPVSRLQILGAKFAALSLYGAALPLCLLLVSYGVSALLFAPTGDVLIFGPMFMLEKGLYLHPAARAVWRIGLSYALAVPMICSVAALSLLFSCTTRHFTSSAILTTTVYFCSYIVGSIPYLSAIHPFLPTRYLPFFRFALLPEIPWGTVALHAGWTGLFSLVFLLVAWAAFARAEL